MPHGEYPEADHGKCRSCGFLSKHAIHTAPLPTPRFYEAEHTERMSTVLLLHHTVGHRMWADTEPMCFLGKVNLQAVLEQQDHEGLLAEINAERGRDGWYPYMPGLSPIEHYQDMQMRDYERKIEDEQITREASYRRQDRNLIILGLILAAGEIIAAIIISARDSYTDQILRRLFGP